LEVHFDPLGLAEHASAVLQQLSGNEDYVPYLPHLRRVVLSRLLSQLSQVYSSLSISYLLDLVAPLNQHLSEDSPHRFDQENIEAFIMGTAKRGELLVRINHASGTLAFVDDSFASPASGAGATFLQPSPGKLVRSRLGQLAESLYTVVKQIDQVEGVDDLAPVKAALHAERLALQARRSIVARRRELAAELQQRKQNEERSLQAELQMRAQEEAQRRKKADALREAQERARAEMDRRRKEENVKIVSSLLDRGVSIDAVRIPAISKAWLTILFRISPSLTQIDWFSCKWSKWIRRDVN
jgi:translation initiation factor 3 subunit A